MEKAYAYVEHWKEAYRDNTGLLLFGDVGTGKSFFAGCIANALLDRDVPVLMTNFPSILNRLTGVFANLKLEEVKNPPDLAHARIYDRILERCAPVLFSGKNFREEGARATKVAAKEIVRKDYKI